VRALPTIALADGHPSELAAAAGILREPRVSVEVEQPTGHSHSRKKTTLEPLQEIDDVSAHVLLLLQNDE
jgi:hypothetical protein